MTGMRSLIAGNSVQGAQIIVSAWATLQDGSSPPDIVAPRADLLSAGADDLGFGTAHLQRELTKEVEDNRSLALPLDILELPAENPKRESYEECRHSDQFIAHADKDGQAEVVK